MGRRDSYIGRLNAEKRPTAGPRKARRPIRREDEQCVEPDLRGEVLGADVPEPVQLAAKQESLFQRDDFSGLGAGREPLDGRLCVRVVVAATPHGFELGRAEDAPRDLGRESDEVVGMRLAGGLHLPAGMELLGREGADRLEQRIPPARADHTHEPLLDERVEFVERAVALLVAVADLLHRFERPALMEDRGAA